MNKREYWVIQGESGGLYRFLSETKEEAEQTINYWLKGKNCKPVKVEIKVVGKMSKEERFEVFGNVVKDNKEMPSLLDNYQCCVRLNQQDQEIQELRKETKRLTNIKNYQTKKLLTKNAKLKQQLKNAIVLPVKLGDKIYVVPSKTNFEINNIHHKERNRIYEWEVHEIRFNKYGYAVVSWIDNIPFFCIDCETDETKNTYETERFYGETWFKTKQEAEQRLKELKGEV